MRLGVIAGASLLLLACSGTQGNWSGDVPAPEVTSFRTQVYPVLLRDCAFPACHGDSHRFFQVYGPGRTRLLMTSKPADPPTPDEIARSYDRARSMLAGSANVEDSLLLSKPLEATRGGQGHEGTDSLGRNVYSVPLEQGYQVLLAWARQVQLAGSQPSAAGMGGGAAGTGGTTGAAGTAATAGAGGGG